MTELCRSLALVPAAAGLTGQTPRLLVWQRLGHHERAALLGVIVVKEIETEIHHARKQLSTWPEHTDAFPPDWRNVWHEKIRSRVKDQNNASSLSWPRSAMSPCRQRSEKL